MKFFSPKNVLEIKQTAFSGIVRCIVVASVAAGMLGNSFAIAADTTTTPSTTETINKIVVRQQIIIKPIILKKQPAPLHIKPNRKNDPASNLTGSVKISTSAAMKPLAQDLIKAFNKKYKKVTVSVFGGQAGIGVLDVSNNRADIGITSKELTKEEAQQGLSSTRIGVDIIAMIVNSKNRIDNLTSSDLFNIYTKTITNWQELRGNNANIAFNTYSSSVGLGDLFDSVIMHGQKMSDKVAIHSTTGSMLNTIKANKNAIGYASLTGIKKGIKPIAINGVFPSIANAKSGRYQFSRNINIVTKGSENAASKAFVQFILSADGQIIMNKHYFRIR